METPLSSRIPQVAVSSLRTDRRRSLASGRDGAPTLRRTYATSEGDRACVPPSMDALPHAIPWSNSSGSGGRFSAKKSTSNGGETEERRIALSHNRTHHPVRGVVNPPTQTVVTVGDQRVVTFSVGQSCEVRIGWGEQSTRSTSPARSEAKHGARLACYVRCKRKVRQI